MSEQTTMWVDTETTGLIPGKSAVVQIAILIERDFEIIGTFNMWIRPHEGADIAQLALDKIDYTVEELEARGEPEEEVYNRLVAFLDHHVSKYDKKDKLVCAGYNTRFDIDMLNAFFRRNNNKYLFSYIHGTFMDVMQFIAYARYSGIIKHREMAGNNLETACKFFGVPIKAHDALADITATRFLFHKILDYAL